MSDFEPFSYANGVVGGLVSPFDRGLSYGDGLFETVRLEAGRLPLWSLHQDRLLEGCRRLQLHLDPGALDEAIAEMVHLARQRDIHRGVLKTVVSRGEGGRGYQPAGAMSPSLLLSLFPLPAQPPEVWEQGVDVLLCDHRLGHNPALAGIKHLNRLDQVLGALEWRDTECREGLLFDQDGLLVEACSRNVFLVQGDCLLTPSLSKAGVAGVLRRLIMEDYAARLGLAVRECSIGREALKTAEEILLTNSISGVWPVESLLDRQGAEIRLPEPKLGRQLQDVFEDDIRTRVYGPDS